MQWRNLVCVALVACLTAGLAVAQNSGARFIGDDGRDGARADNVLRKEGDSAVSRMAVGQNTKPNNELGNLRGGARTPPPVFREDNQNTDIFYRKFNRDTGKYEVVNLGKDPTPREWTKFLGEKAIDPNFPDVNFNGVNDVDEKKSTGKDVEAVAITAPKNRLRVIDQGKLRELAEQGKTPPKVFRQVTKIERYQVAIPVYETRCVTAYPCCCTRCYSQLVRYDYEWRSRVIASYKEEAGADYPSTEISVARDVVVVAGNPQYTTEIPRLCEFHYGKGAKIDAPTVPLVATVGDAEAKAQIGAVVETEGNITTIKEGVAVSELLVPGTEGGLPPGDVRGASPRDRGTNKNQGDVATVQDNLTVAVRDNPRIDPRTGKPDPLDMTIRRPRR
jgi:hypothetical protein